MYFFPSSLSLFLALSFSWIQRGKTFLIYHTYELAISDVRARVQFLQTNGAFKLHAINAWLHGVINGFLIIQYYARLGKSIAARF